MHRGCAIVDYGRDAVLVRRRVGPLVADDRPGVVVGVGRSSINGMAQPTPRRDFPIRPGICPMRPGMVLAQNQAGREPFSPEDITEAP